jgi:hypothetical protein
LADFLQSLQVNGFAILAGIYAAEVCIFVDSAESSELDQKRNSAITASISRRMRGYWFAAYLRFDRSVLVGLGCSGGRVLPPKCANVR